MIVSPADSAAAVVRRRTDGRQDRITLLRATAIIAVGYGAGAALQSTYVYATLVPEWLAVPISARLGANAVAVVVLVGVLAVLQAHRTRPWPWTALCIAAAAVVAGMARYLAQLAFGVYDEPSAATRDAEVLSGFLLGAISAGLGMWTVATRRTARARTRAATRDAVHVELALKALEQEEIRVRRAVAEGLHGTLQSKMILIDARLGDVLSRAQALDEGDAESLAWVRRELDEAREIDVRQMSRLLYPERVELGLVPALRALLGRIPASVATRLTVSDAVRAIDDPTDSVLTLSERLLAIRVVEEAVTNALKHGPASSITVTLDVAQDVLHVSVLNDGELYVPATAGAPSGTQQLSTRLSFVGGRLALTPGPEKGARLEAWLPLGAGAE
ncbi:sensor histidine kinase [Cellulomonas fengjieae]|uniref:histidine kinase n=1 Tax=Cellulomonas fengjieae TaxID=2819978 RepID=A0ABS3SH68_9CELL|nr:ATP-binding protein [Cellulomonas fengjieae]MBO3084992.1 ATP-binding protein [Cellulomonas fengjieae]MBO3100739.1 ATP-binding protein [Cellulomonas fengjieae]QVI66410.1 ATP-binding protein [Cellulomonas fengjieae]